MSMNEETMNYECTKCGSEFPEDQEAITVEEDGLLYAALKCRACNHLEFV